MPTREEQQKAEQLRRQREIADELARQRKVQLKQQRWQGIVTTLAANSQIRGSVAAKG